MKRPKQITKTEIVRFRVTKRDMRRARHKARLQLKTLTTLTEFARGLMLAELEEE